MQMRISLIKAMRAISFYGQHLSGFQKEVKQLPRITQLETQPEIDLQSSETQEDEQRKDQELEILGLIGQKNPKQPYLKFNDAVQQIEKTIKELC